MQFDASRLKHNVSYQQNVQKSLRFHELNLNIFVLYQILPRVKKLHIAFSFPDWKFSYVIQRSLQIA